MKKTIKMEWVKATKGTHVYANNEPEAPVSTLYIKKSGRLISLRICILTMYDIYFLKSNGLGLVRPANSA